MEIIKNDIQFIKCCESSIIEASKLINHDHVKIYLFIKEYYEDLASLDINRFTKVPLSVILFCSWLIGGYKENETDIKNVIDAFKSNKSIIDNYSISDAEDINNLGKLINIYNELKKENEDEKKVKLLYEIIQTLINKLRLNDLNENIDIFDTFSYSYKILDAVLLFEKHNENFNYKSDDFYKKLLSNFATLLHTFYEAYKEIVKIMQTQINNYKYFIDLIQNKKLKEVNNLQEIFDHENFVSINIINYLYSKINKELHIQYDKIKKENIVLEKKSELNDVDYLISSYHIPLKSVLPNQKELLMRKGNLSTIKNTIDLFIDLGFSPNEALNTNLFIFLINITEQDIKDIHSLLTSKYITFEFIRNNLGVLISETIENSDYEPLLPKVKENINILINSKFPFNNINYNPEILLYDKEMILTLIEYLKPYNLKDDNYTYLFYKTNYLTCLDLMIENKIPLYLLPSICETSNYLLTIKKIMLCKALSVPYLNLKGLLLPIIYKKGTYNIYDNIDEYIENDNEFQFNDVISPKIIEKNNIDYLEKFYDDTTKCYEFESCSISKNKFIRIYSNGNDLKLSLLANSILTQEMIEEITSKLNLKTETDNPQKVLS